VETERLRGREAGFLRTSTVRGENTNSPSSRKKKKEDARNWIQGESLEPLVAVKSPVILQDTSTSPIEEERRKKSTDGPLGSEVGSLS